MKQIEKGFVFRLVIVQIILIGIQILTMPALLKLLSDNVWFQWTILALECIVCAAFLFLDCTVQGSRDVMHDEISEKQNIRTGKDPTDYVPAFVPTRGIFCALVAISPLIAAALTLQVAQLCGAAWAGTLEAVLRITQFMLSHIWMNFTEVPGALFLVLNAAFVGVAGWGYFNGKAQRRRTNLVIERNNARIARGQAIKKGRNKRK